MSRRVGIPLKETANDAGPPLSPLPAPSGRTGWSFALPVLIVLYLVVATSHAILAPSGTTGYQNAPDEAAHVTFVRVVAAGRLPTRENPGIPGQQTRLGYEWHQPPLYYLIAARFLPLGEKGVRLCSILIGVCCILTVYKACRLLLPNSPQTAVLASAITALNPAHCAITSVVNNDGLLELCFSGFLLIVLTGLTKGFSSARAVLLGATLGAALLTKATAILLLPTALLALASFVIRGEPRAHVIRYGVIIYTIAFALSGWWFWRNRILYHEWLPLTVFQETFEGTAKASDVMSGRSGLPVDGVLSYAALVAKWTFQSFWAVYSTERDAIIGAPRFLPGQLYILLALISGSAAIRFAALYFRRGVGFTRVQITGLGLMLFLLGLVGISFISFASHYFQAQGRYWYPAMVPITVILSIGWRALFPRRYVDLATILLMTLLGICCLAFLRYVA